MKKANLPTKKASEPEEEAHQPILDTMTPKMVRKPTKKLITFADDTDTEKSPSQRSSTYKEVLSQPAPSLSHREKLVWLQKRRTAGLWAQCDDCDRWRFLPNVLDSYELPDKWYCRMNPDTASAECSVPEAPIQVRQEEDLIHAEYAAGSVVWARLPGWPWWPAMVDDCPDTEQYYWLDGFSDIPTHYNVVFFDSTDATRGWISPENLKPYAANKSSFKPLLKSKKYKSRLQEAMKQADTAVKLTQPERLEKYSFIARYQGTLNSPTKITKKDLKKQQKILKRKYNIEFDLSLSDDDCEPPKSKRQNVILLGTPKTKKTDRKRESTDANAVTSTVKFDESTEIPECVPVNVGEQNTEASTNDDFKRQASIKNVFKRPNSLAVQVGSTDDTPMVEDYDDDTSKTYAPAETASQESTQTTQISTSDITEMQVRIVSPRSDDFDF